MEALVVGAGVVGLAIARALVLRGAAVIVAEAAEAIGTGVSARSSEVIHGGMYYPPVRCAPATASRGAAVSSNSARATACPTGCAAS